MKINNLTWLGFIATLTALSLPTKILAYEPNLSSENQPLNLETRLNKIADRLHLRAKELEGDLPIITDNPNTTEIAGSWVKGNYRGRFLNNSGGGGFLNNRGGWGDGGGFINRRY